jgi:hypothetical protein
LRNLGQFWRASESEVWQAIRDRSLPEVASLVCLRRHVPAWWAGDGVAASGPSRIHVPIPPSTDPGCRHALEEFVCGAWRQLPKPTLIFCKEGKHRTGMLSGILRFEAGASMADAVHEYVRGLTDEPRPSELELIRILCRPR